MAKKTTYSDHLRDEMSGLIDQLQLPDLHKQALKSRWLDQVVWADKKADQCRRWHYRLRLTTIIGGVILPALVGINFQVDKDSPFLRGWFPYLPFALSQIIAVSAAAEEFCRFGDRWRDYRRMAEDLKAEGWQYLQLSGPYQYSTVAVDSRPLESQPAIAPPQVQMPPPPARSTLLKKRTTHAKSYALFASRVESIIKNDVQNYISDLMKQQLKEEQEVEKYVETAQSVTQDKTLFSQTSLNSQPPESYPNSSPLSPPASLTSAYAAPGYPIVAPGTSNFAAPIAPPSQSALMSQPNESLAMASTQAIAPVASPSSPVGIAGTLKTRQDTEFKLSPQPSQTLPAPQKVFVGAGSAFGLLACAPADNNHLHITLNQGLGAENRNTWFAYAPHIELIGSNGQPQTLSTVTFGNAQQPGGVDLNAAIAAAAASLRGISTADGPDGGNNACAWTVNRVLQTAGISPLGDNPNYVPSLLDALKAGRGQLVAKAQAQAGDLVIACGEEHIGIGLDAGCNRVLSNSSSRACFLWESDTDFDGYYGGASTIYRLIR